MAALTKGEKPRVTKVISIALCPSCKATIPAIKVVSEEGLIFLQIKCSCRAEFILSHLDSYLESINELNKAEEGECGDYFCKVKEKKNLAYVYHANSEHWLCPEHLKYCESTDFFFNKKVNLKMIDKYHPIDSKLKDFNTKAIIEEFERIDGIIEVNQKYRDDFNQWIDALSEPREDWRSEVNEAFNRNRDINIQLKALCLLIKETAVLLKDSTDLVIELVSLQKVAPYEQLKVSSSEVEKSYHLLKKHFTENYALVIAKKDTLVQFKYNCTYNCVKRVLIDEYLCKMIQLQDGRVASCARRQIKLWSSSSLECLQSIEAHSCCVASLLQLRDGRLVSGDGNRTIKVWNVSTFECLKSFVAHFALIGSLIQLKDERLASASWDNYIKVWCITSFACLSAVEAHSFSVLTLIQLEDGRLASSGNNGLLKLWDVSSLQCLQSAQADSCMTQIYQLRDGRLLSGGRTECFYVWDVSLLQCLQAIPVTFWEVYSFFQLEDGRLFIGGGSMLQLWDVSTFECIKSFKSSSVHSIILLQNGQLMSLATNRTFFDTYNNKSQSLFTQWEV